LIEARAYRYMPNTSNDDDTRYRSREEVDQWRQRDPINRLRAHLLESGTREGDLVGLEQAVSDEVAEATTWAEAQPDAEPAHVLQHTWADQAVRATDWMRA
jgi:2-oxoisovalerate dehydrogenase E1 component alpha subunit